MTKPLNPRSLLVNKFDLYALVDSGYTILSGSAQTVTARLQSIISNNTSGYVDDATFNILPFGTAQKSTRTIEIQDTVAIQGFDVTQTKLPIYSNTNGGELSDGNGNDVYGVLSYNGVNFILTLKAGGSVYTPPATSADLSQLTQGSVVDVIYPYYANELSVPSGMQIFSTHINYQTSATAKPSKRVTKNVAITALNTFAQLVGTPLYTDNIEANIAGNVYSASQGDFSVSGTTITWLHPIATAKPEWSPALFIYDIIQ